MTTTKPIASMSGHMRKICRAALDVASEHGCDTRHATISFNGKSHPKVSVTGPAGQTVRFPIASSPKSIGKERNNMARRIRRALRRHTEGGPGHE